MGLGCGTVPLQNSELNIVHCCTLQSINGNWSNTFGSFAIWTGSIMNNILKHSLSKTVGLKEGQKNVNNKNKERGAATKQTSRPFYITTTFVHGVQVCFLFDFRPKYPEHMAFHFTVCSPVDWHRAQVVLFLFGEYIFLTFLFSCLNFINIRCLRCLFFISDKLNVGGSEEPEGSAGSDTAGPFSSDFSGLFFCFFCFLTLPLALGPPSDTGTSMKSML